MPFISLSIDRKIAVYEAQIVSIIMYNCSSWSPTAKSLEKLDICHRRHLRALLNIRWPHGIITNVDLYKRCLINIIQNDLALRGFKNSLKKLKSLRYWQVIE